MSDISDAELDAATEAYVGMRWPDIKNWREKWPTAWEDTRAKVREALIAAARVRADGGLDTAP